MLITPSAVLSLTLKNWARDTGCSRAQNMRCSLKTNVFPSRKRNEVELGMEQNPIV